MSYTNVPFRLVASLVAGVCLCSARLEAQLLPTDVGTTVNGFQDDFDGGSLNPNWVVRGQNAFSVSGGMLHVTTTAGDPNHLLYERSGYNNSTQEVLARLRVTNFGTGDPARGGVGVGVDPATSQGINFHFRDFAELSLTGRHTALLDDARLWGPGFGFVWQNNVWYWMRLRQEPNAASQGGANDVFAKVWLADGSAAEPAVWQLVSDYTPARSTRTGFAGVTAGSLSGTSEFDVDYVLIKASGLPSIRVAPNAFIQTPVAITNQPQSQTIVQGNAATFTAGTRGSPPPTFQWYRNEAPISGGTNASYTIPAVQTSDNGAVFKVVAQNVASNTTYTVTSSNAVLTVLRDDVPPSLALVQTLGLTQVQITFSEPVTAASATNANHYQITNSSGSLTISSASLDASRSNVVLSVSAMTESASYTLVVNQVADNAGNVIPPNTKSNFTALSFAPAAIGNPQPGGGAVTVPGGLNVTAGGRDIGGTSDQFQFNYQGRTGDFDVQVRIDSISLVNAWSEAGLLAREDLNAGGRFASAMATPNISGLFFQYRTATNGATTLTGSFPVNYPNTWLRLQRQGNQFTGYGGFDGQKWTALGSVSIAMPATLYLGFAASSHNTNQTTTVAFRDFSNVTAPSVYTGPPAVEPLGQSSRRTGLVISEIMYNPADRVDGKNLEFVELFNSLGTAEDISGWRLDGEADFLFPPNTILPGGAFLVVANSPADLESVYGLSGVLGPFSSTNSLNNTRGTIQLRHRTGAVFLEAQYDTAAPWPVAADGAGHSLVLARPSFGERNAAAWAASDVAGGSPGRLDPVPVDPLRDVVINEFLANTEEPQLDFIELYNHSTQPLDISGCHLSDARNTNKFTIPLNTVLPPRGFMAFNQNQLGFALSSSGERIYFRNPANTRVLDAVRFDAQATGVSSGRSPDGAPGLAELAAPTPGTNNAAFLIRDLVINEIMYNPISRESDDEYVELYNRGSTAVNLAGWRLDGGVTFTFPAQAAIPADGYLVIARNAARLLARYPNLNANNTVGDYSGALANGGERIALARPEPSLTTNSGVVTTNFDYIVVDEVTYGPGGRWGRWSDGGGSSLELIDARSDNRLAANWADSDETAKAPWTTLSVSGVLDNGTSTADQLQVFLQGPGECLIDDVEVRTLAGANSIANSTFESNANGWTAEGTQEPSSLETTEGFNSTRSYHVRATDRGDNQVNRIRTPLTVASAANTTNTIRAKVRWLRGHPEILFRLRGNTLEAAVTMDLPTNLGTPGARNSRAVVNAAPAIYDVTHYPPVPAANQPVIVSARVHDPDGLAAVLLRYRLDPSLTLSNVAMLDNGTGGDAVAGDGLYSATLPGQATNTLVAFHVQAADSFSPSATATFPNNPPTRECLVRFGESGPSGSFPSYRLWMTLATFNTWDARNNLNNTLNDVTFVFGHQRVIYNAGAVYAGSPYIAPGFTTPSGNRCGYAIELPPDDRFLGDSALQLDWPGGHGNENTAIQEQMAYWIADQINIPFSHRYFIRLAVNGATDMQRGGVFEAVIQPGGDFLDQWSPGDSDGDFFKIDRAFEFSDAGGLIADPEPQLRIYNTPDLVRGGLKKKTEKYRWYWIKRSFEQANDYTNVFVVADALNSPGPEPYTSQTEALVDVEEWMGIFAAEHIINNFDSWGHDIGKNMYMFKPQQGRWQLYMFDLDWLMLVSVNGPGNYSATTGPLFSSDDPTVTRMYNHPPFRRAYFRAVQAAVSNAFVASKYEAVMDAKYNSLVANGITLCDGQALAAPTAVKTWFSQRRTALASQLTPVTGPFTVNGTNSFTISSNLLTLTGTAPITVKTIEINGVAWPVIWTSVSNWTIRLPLVQATNQLTVLGYDVRGSLVGGTSNRVTVVYNGPAPEAVDAVVINEIMYHPVVPDAEFVELFNTSANFAFDLTGWRVNGLDYVFPEGSFLGPRGLLVLVKNREAAAQAYGTNLVVFDVFSGNLQANGETLTLLQPGDVSGTELTIDTVRYESGPPWPTRANGFGPSLQLIDSTQDNSRAGNWSSETGWAFASRTGNILNATNLLLWITTAGNAYVDDITLTGPGGTNIVLNGDFESDLGAEWIISTNYTAATIVSDISHSGRSSLFLNGTSGGGGALNTSLQQLIADRVVTNTPYTLSFWCLANTNSVTVNTRTLPGNNLAASAISAKVLFTPGAPNAIATTLPPFPPLWINEVQPENVNGITDHNGQHDPWLELYNSGTNAVVLSGLYLANNYTNLAQWTFPNGSVINPGEFKIIFADGDLNQSIASELHTSFRLSPGAGSVVLSRPYGGAAQVLDYVNYSGVEPGRSYGSFPDGQPFDRQQLFQATAGGANNGTSAPLVVFINEWMASNTRTIGDPATISPRFDDWFELYNPGATPVSLAGYFLTDNLTNQFQYEIPAGYSIAPHGFLLVWADNEPGQNSSNRIDLHVNFQLNRDGEAIGLFATDGTAIDTVTFGAQTNDVSEGRWPDGAAHRYFMPTPTPHAANVIPVQPGEVRIVQTSIAPNGDIVITWTAEAGKTYRLQFKTELNDTEWTDLDEVMATGPRASSTTTTSAAAQRFYRIQRVTP